MQPFSITLFATTGDPEGIRHLDKSNWSGYGVVFSKELFHLLKQEPGFSQAGIYILVGNAAEETNVDDHGLDQRQACIITGRLICRNRWKIQGQAQVAGGGVEAEMNGGLELGMDLCVAHCNDFHGAGP